MRYGDLLAHAAAGLARAHVSLRDPPPHPRARAGAALLRLRLYRSLERQIVAIGGVHLRALPPSGEPPMSYRHTVPGRDPVTLMAVELRYAVAHTTMAAWTHPTATVDDPPATWSDPAGISDNASTGGRVGTALHQACQAVQTAGDILFGHTGPQVGFGARQQPLTTEGAAVLAGVGRPDSIAALAKLTAAAAALDVRLARWMWPEEAPEDLQPLLSAAEQDAWHTRTGPLDRLATAVSAGGQAESGPVLGMLPAPPVDDPHRWTHPGSGRDCVDALDAARAWLTRHGPELTVGQLAGTARAALAITHYAGHVHVNLARDATAVTAGLIAAAQPWRDVLHAAGQLRSPVPAGADHSTLTAAVGGAATWLREKLRPDGHWLTPWTHHPNDRTGWQDTADQITARMPDLADLLHHAIGQAYERGSVLATTGELNPRSFNLIHSPHWGRAPHQRGPYPALRAALTTAAAHARDLAAAVDVHTRPGLHDARTTRLRAYQPPPSAAQLAQQWYPNPDGPAEPSAPPPTAVPRSTGHRASSSPRRPEHRHAR